MCGKNNTGQLGQNNVVDLSSPVQVPGTTWVNIGSANYQTFATKTDGTLLGWGVNAYGALGQNQAPAQLPRLSSPVQIPGTTWASIVPLLDTMFATKTDGTLWAWGRNYSGKLGQNAENPDYAVSSPVQIPGTDWNTTQGKQIGDGVRGHHICWLKD